MADPIYTPSVKNRVRFDRPQGLSDEQAQMGRENLKVDAAMQAALLAMWSTILGRTVNPNEPGVPWTQNGHVLISSGPALGIGQMSIGTSFVVS